MTTDDGPTREALEALIGDRIVGGSRLEPWSVMRCQLERSRASVIVKWRRRGAVRNSPRQIIVEHAALTFLQHIGVARGPRLLASDLDAGLLVLEDLAPRRPLDQQIRAAGVASAWPGLAAFVRTMGELAAQTSGRGAAFEACLIRSGASPSDTRIAEAQATLAMMRGLEGLGLSLGGPVETDLATAFATLQAPGPFQAFSNGDCEANNFLSEGGEGRLIDFEAANFRHALIDAAAIHVPGPAWLTVAGPSQSAELEQIYRTALATRLATADDDQVFGLGMAAACLTRACERFTRFPRLDDRPSGDASRLQMVSALEAAAEAASRHRRLPQLAGWAWRAGAWLRRRWPDADQDLERLGPYAPRVSA